MTFFGHVDIDALQLYMILICMKCLINCWWPGSKIVFSWSRKKKQETQGKLLRFTYFF